MSLPPAPRRVIAVASNKGGVGKTTVATNLAIYLRALREDLPVLIVGLDDQQVVDRMFALAPLEPGQPNIKHAWAERTLEGAICLGQYGIHFVPSPPETEALKTRAGDPGALGRILERTDWPGVVILDTKSDLEALTRNALHAADLAILPVADRSSLEEAAKIYSILGPRRAHVGRVLFTLVDGRTRGEGGHADLHHVLARDAASRGWSSFATHLSRSPRAEALISAGGVPLSVLHHGRGSVLHRQLRELAEEVMKAIGCPLPEAVARPVPRPASGLRSPGVGDWKTALLRGLRR